MNGGERLDLRDAEPHLPGRMRRADQRAVYIEEERKAVGGGKTVGEERRIDHGGPWISRAGV